MIPTLPSIKTVKKYTDARTRWLKELAKLNRPNDNLANRAREAMVQAALTLAEEVCQ